MDKLCSYLPENSELHTFVDDKSKQMDEYASTLSSKYPGIKISIAEIDLNDLEKLHKIKPENFDSLLILSPGGNTIEEMDAYVISLLIRIRQILLSNEEKENVTKSDKTRKWPKLITEVMDSENIDIILNSGVEDFMVSNQFVSQIMAQVSEEPLALDVYDDLFKAEGSELYIKPASYYFDFNDQESISLAYGEKLD